MKYVIAFIVLFLTAEFILRWLKFRKCPILLIKKPKFLRKRHKSGISTTVDHLPVKRQIIRSISTLILKDFITCCVTGDLSVLGDGSDVELHEAFTSILSQYYECKKDESMSSYIRLERDIKALEMRRYWTAVLCDIMHEMYSPACAEALSKLYPMYQFAKESYHNDISLVGKAEIKNNIKYERLVKQKEKRDAEKGGANVSPEEKHRNIISNLMDINKIEGVKYDVYTMTVLEYAIAENRKQEYIENLKATR